MLDWYHIPRHSLNHSHPMSELKLPEIIVHAVFQEYECDLEEILKCITAFLEGDCGVIKDEDEVLGFMRRTMEQRLRHGVYETTTAGRIHVVGDSERIMAMPDVIFAQGTQGTPCSINTCTCKTPPEVNKKPKSKKK